MMPTQSIHFVVKDFSELSINELYAILQLRSEVFVIEQDCLYQDIDGKDQQALHIMGYQQNKLVAYARVFKQGDYYQQASIGRVVVKKSARQANYGHKLIEFSIKTIENKFNTTTIKISAQVYLQHFYQIHGFHPINEVYLEDGIEHIAMLK